MTKSKDSSKNTGICAFCNKSGTDAGALIYSHIDAKIMICEHCVKQGLDQIENFYLQQKTKASSKINLRDHLPVPTDIYQHLEQYVIGQKSTCKKLAVSVCNHYKRLMDARLGSKNTFVPKELADTQLDKSNILMLGPTGSGKTLLARSIAKRLDVPFAIGDATTLTESGYVGEDVENLILKLLYACDMDVEKAERGIIFIDEIDKIAKKTSNVSITRDVSGEGVQQSLLKLIEGQVCNVPPQGGRKHPEQQYIRVDTSNILFICGGSFVGLEDIITKRLGKNNVIGFNSNKENSEEEQRQILSQVQREDLEAFGLIPELIGRLPIITTLDKLTLDELKRILREPKNSIISQFRKILAYDGYDLQFEESALDEIAAQAEKRGTGARALRSVIESFMQDLQFDLPKRTGNIAKLQPLVVTVEHVKGGKFDHNVEKEAA